MIGEQYVLYGGGDFALEVATILMDVLAVSDIAEKRDANTSAAVVTDIVSNSEPRSDALEDILGTIPLYHAQFSTVADVDRKRVLICIGNAQVRHRIYNDLCGTGVTFATVVHPTAYVSSTAKIGSGSIICPFGFVGPFACVGNNCVINVQSVVGHDVKLGDSTVLSPCTDINGWASTGTAAFLGAGAIMQPKAKLGAYSKLSSGSVLVGEAGDGYLMHGNPAKGRQMMKPPAIFTLTHR